MFMHTESATVIIHYFRFDQRYDGWNVWAWADGKDGLSSPFGIRDDFGATAVVRIGGMQLSTRIGVLLRRSLPGNDWAEKELDDRYIEELGEDDTAEVWIIEGDKRIYTSRALAESRKVPRITEAIMISERQICVEWNILHGEHRLDDRFKLYTKDGNPVVLRQIVPTGTSGARLEAEECLSVLESYVVRFDGCRGVPVSLAGMFDHPEFERHYCYQGSDLGARYSPSATAFRVWAPTADEVLLTVYADGADAVGRCYPMERSAQGTWVYVWPGDHDGAFYTYRVRFQDEWEEAVDPYAFALTANGRRGAVINLERTAPKDWHADTRPPFHFPTDAIIYELHVRDATVHPDSGVSRPGTYIGLSERGTTTPGGFPTGLDYIASLGVTHVQLLPVNDFVSVDETETDPERKQYNWGYDPAYYFVPEGSYATDPADPASRIRELRQLISAFHRRGIRVVLDVVFNHMYSAARSCLGRLVPGYYFRREADWRPANGTGVGNDTASERAMMRKLIADCVEHWTREYHVDGFRFDLMGIHDIDTMNLVRERLDGIDPSILVYGEGWHLNTPLPAEKKATLANAARMPRIGLFCDAMRDGLRGSVFDAADRGFINGAGARAHDVCPAIAGAVSYGPGMAGHAAEPCQTINYAEVHDNHTLWDRLQCTNPEEPEPIRRAMQRLAASILLTSQGIPLFHAGQEWFRTKGGDHNSYRSPDAVNRIDWNRAAYYREDIAYVKGLIALRRKHALFRLQTADQIRRSLRMMDTPHGVIAFLLARLPETDCAYEFIVVAHNSLDRPVELAFPANFSGRRWAVLCDGEHAGPDPLREMSDATYYVVPGLSTFVCGA